MRQLRSNRMRDGGSLPLYKLGLCFLFVLWAVVLVSSPAWAQDLEPTACEGCTASVMNQIAAAFATQGYWVQADLIYQLGSTDLGLWTPLLYIMAVFSGLIMMAMGQPPRIYMWFLLGPAIYNWLLFTPTERAGVSWIVANHVQDQKEVWKLAEVGLINSNEIIRQGLTPDADNGPESRASIAMPFAWYDDLISAQIQFLVGWSGIYRREDSKGGSTNISAESAGGGALRGGKNAAWHILTNSKWPILDNITASSVHNQDLRESFVTFFASECGDTIAKYISKSKYVSAAHAKGAKLPSTVFKEGIYTGGSNTIDKLVEELKSTIIPVPGAFVSLLADKSSGGSLPKFSNALNVDSPQSMRFIDCNYYLWVLVQGFRWEAGHIYNQVIAEGTDAGIEASQVVDTFLYGWRIGYKRDSKGSAEKLSPEDQAQYIINLILLHLFRNEWAMTPSPVNPRFSSSERSENYASAYMRNVGSKSKYGELYTWAKLMPFIQGVLLYILIAAYPFVCIVIVIPGWWKSMFTWMGFYAWAKSWDAGFAIVMSIERSIWAMLGNSSDAAQFNQIVASMRNLGQVRIDDGETLATAEYTASCAMDKLLHCVEPFVRTVEEQTMGKAIETLDKGLLMAARLDLDLANAYYIYIMSALYFAVPAITGQILLGAKAGASGMISTMVGGSAQEGGRGAGSSFTSEAGTRGHHAVASVNQAGFARELRQSGLAMGALTAGNQALKQDLRAAEAGTGNALNEQLQGYARMQQAWDDNNIKRVGAFKSLMPALKGKGSKSGSTGSSGEGTTGTESFKKPGLGSKIWSGISGVAQGINDGFNPASTLAETENVRDYLAANEAATAARMNMSIGSFEAQAMGKGYQITGNRYSSWGQQRAGEAQWRAARNFGTQVAGYTASLGISPAAFHAGSKPVHIDGMAGMGMLNTYGGSAGNVYSVDDARGTFIYPTDGYLQEVGAARSGLETLSGQIQKTFTVPGKSMGATLQQIMGAPFRPVYQAKTPHGVGRG